MGKLTEKVRSRGHWNAVIRPATFIDDRISYEQLDEIIPSVQVRMRGWPVPMVDLDRRKLLRGGLGWTGCRR